MHHTIECMGVFVLFYSKHICEILAMVSCFRPSDFLVVVFQILSNWPTPYSPKKTCHFKKQNKTKTQNKKKNKTKQNKTEKKTESSIVNFFFHSPSFWTGNTLMWRVCGFGIHVSCCGNIFWCLDVIDVFNCCKCFAYSMLIVFSVGPLLLWDFPFSVYEVLYLLGYINKDVRNIWIKKKKICLHQLTHHICMYHLTLLYRTWCRLISPLVLKKMVCNHQPTKLAVLSDLLGNYLNTSSIRNEICDINRDHMTPFDPLTFSGVNAFHECLSSSIHTN